MPGTGNSEKETLRVVALSGTLHQPSKTGRLIDGVLAALSARTSVEAHTVEVLSLGHQLIDALGGDSRPELATELARVADADVLVVATPVYKGSYTGLLKLFIDLLGQDSLVDRPVILAAAGGSDQHSLVIEHELRPLLGFFRAHSVPTGVYARATDFLDDGLSDALQSSIDAAATQAVDITRR